MYDVERYKHEDHDSCERSPLPVSQRREERGDTPRIRLHASSRTCASQEHKGNADPKSDRRTDPKRAEIRPIKEEDGSGECTVDPQHPQNAAAIRAARAAPPSQEPEGERRNENDAEQAEPRNPHLGAPPDTSRNRNAVPAQQVAPTTLPAVFLSTYLFMCTQVHVILGPTKPWVNGHMLGRRSSFSARHAFRIARKLETALLNSRGLSSWIVCPQSGNSTRRTSALRAAISRASRVCKTQLLCP